MPRTINRYHQSNTRQPRLLILRITVIAFAIVSISLAGCSSAPQSNSSQMPSAGQSSGSSPQAALNNNPVGAPAPPASQSCADALAKGTAPKETMEVNKAVMVTVELNFGGRVPSIAEAITQVERCYKTDDGTNTRTFAILDAYGEPTPDGKLLHMSMHVSSEKPGIGMLIFKRTGEVLWHSRILPTTQVSLPKSLTILIDAGGGRSFTVDGSNNPASVLDANVKELGQPVKSIWADGTEREVTFIYSACGCPVKVMARRVGDRFVRTKDTPVIFPDDPAAVQTIARLMRW